MTITVSRLSGGTLTLPEPVSMECSVASDIPADGFTAVFPAQGLENSGEFISLTVLMEGVTVFDGLVDEQILTVNRDGAFLTVKARGRAAVLLDNEAVPQVMYRANLWDVYNACVRQYGFDGIVYDRNPVLSAFIVAKGQSEWQAMESFCRQTLGIAPYISDNRVMAKPRPIGRKLLFSNSDPNGILYSSVRLCNKRYAVITKMILKSESKLYDTVVVNAEAQRLQMKRKRYVSPPKEWGGNVKNGAQNLMRDSMRKKLVVTVALPSITRVEAGDLVEIPGYSAGYPALVVREVIYRVSGAGASTEVSLIAPEYMS